METTEDILKEMRERQKAQEIYHGGCGDDRLNAIRDYYLDIIGDFADRIESANKEREEREKKYEYAVKICFGSEEDYALDLYDDLDMAKEMAELPSGDNRKIFRRSVGEWEEVK